MAIAGMIGIDHVEFYVRELDRYRPLFDRMGFSVSDQSNCQEGRGETFRSGPCAVRCVQPLSDDSGAAQFLAQHADGVGVIVFAVEDVGAVATALERRGGTFTSDLNETDQGRSIDMTTPIGGLMFRFVERHEPRVFGVPGYQGFDHFTCHLATMAPVIWWLEEVLGFERFWQFEFHTRTACEGMREKRGTGMRSQVMRCPATGVTFALNEPLRPDFRNSQVWQFIESNVGAGVQHIALNVPEIGHAVNRLGRDQFLATPGCYYDALGARLRDAGVGSISECIDTLRPLGVLVDGEGPGQYLLQIFMRSIGELSGDPRGSPFFFELIQRKGSQGFGSGNFRALFEAIERQQPVLAATH